ncbi:MAG: glycosyltransferase family 2 protein [Marmoricola sp.]
MIDILMPYYGDPMLLRAAVQSVLDQDNPDWRLVVVDNDYPDRTPGTWVEQLGDSRVRYLRNERNLGVSGNLRRCLELAEASHFVIMGADDLLHPNYVSVIREAVSLHGDVTMVQPKVRVIDQDGAVINPLGDRIKTVLAPRRNGTHLLAGERLAASLLRGNWLYFPALTWNRSKIAGRTFRDDMETVFDLDFVMELIISGASMALLETEAFSYRRHASSVSSLTARDTARFEEESRLFDELVPRLVHAGWTKAARAARWHTTSRLHAATLLPGALSSGDTGIARLLTRHVVGLPGGRL